jgi:hypothetical protein
MKWDLFNPYPTYNYSNMSTNLDVSTLENPYIQVIWEDTPENFTQERIKSVKQYFMKKYSSTNINVITKVKTSEAKPFFGLNHVESYVDYYDYFGHWIDYMETFFEVVSYGLGGVSNQEIIWQLSNLPEYVEGDRIIIIFTGAERYTWIHENRRYTFANGSPLPEMVLDKKYLNLFRQQYVEKYEYWMSDMDYHFEKKFINIFPSFFKKYEPLCVTWRGEVAEKIDSIELLDFDNYNFSSITKESEGRYIDGHLGAFGNLELFKYFAKKLNLDIDENSYNVKKIRKKIL